MPGEHQTRNFLKILKSAEPGPLHNLAGAEQEWFLELTPPLGLLGIAAPACKACTHLDSCLDGTVTKDYWNSSSVSESQCLGWRLELLALLFV
ncbi:hypothetical protein Y1Q_0000917 [Alligator mississippiensis]|uniref:Uncharacterized protein n=1 Tax=Alligator mississippiensis TaxID=8496 RepID=A0A151NDW2_ALLMI|nr:hypothetical protein Y1Q_0000917 [Alligator mississippiensis]